MLFKMLKKIFPKTLLGRSLTILFMPVLLLQLVMSYVFVDRYLSKVSELLAGSIAAQVAVLTSVLEREDLPKKDLMPLLNQHFGFEVEVLPPQAPPKTLEPAWLEEYLRHSLDLHLEHAFSTKLGEDLSQIDVYTGDHTYRFTFESKRFFLKTTLILLWWALLTPFLLLCIATVFMRNQVRPLRHLALVVEAFGKGRAVDPFEPKGALEVRRVARTFHAMRERITRQREQRTQMLAGVSHDLRTPLTRMSLQLAVMPETPDVLALKEDLQEMTKTLEGYLSFARGEGAEAMVEIDGPGFMDGVLKGTSSERVFATLPQEEWHLMGRPHGLHRCLSNLVHNALRYASHLWLEVSVEENGISFLLDDNGPGIPVSLREEVFKPFIRLEGSRNPATGGTGLGLAIARDIARSHGGDIELDESPQGGLRVHLFIPS